MPKDNMTWDNFTHNVLLYYFSVLCILSCVLYPRVCVLYVCCLVGVINDDDNTIITHTLKHTIGPSLVGSAVSKWLNEWIPHVFEKEATLNYQEVMGQSKNKGASLIALPQTQDNFTVTSSSSLTTTVE